jgi:protocatechuate 3,4-dioxygenase beta subunit
MMYGVEDTNKPPRRRFIERATALLLFPVWARALSTQNVQPLARVSGFPQMPTGFVGVTPCGSQQAPERIPVFARLAPAAEPGDALHITGTIYQSDEVTPAADIALFLYHTDAHGHYNQPNNPFKPRIHGWVKSDANGRYEFVTIKPAPYPELRTPAHIHVNIFGPRVPEYWVDDYWFEGDPLITPAQLSTLTGRGGFTSIIKLTRAADGMLHGTRNFKLERGFAAGDCRQR